MFKLSNFKFSKKESKNSIFETTNVDCVETTMGLIHACSVLCQFTNCPCTISLYITL